MYETTNFTNLKQLCKDIQKNLYKILVLGDVGVGKTAYIRSVTANGFDHHTTSTVGCDYAMKQFTFQNETLKFQLWDISGQERSTQMSRLYYSKAVGAMILFDVSKPDSFASVLKWKSSIDECLLLPNGNYLPCVLVASKFDKPLSSKLSYEAMSKFCEENNFIGLVKVSSMMGLNVEEPLKLLADVFVNKEDLYPYICPSELIRNEIITLREEDVDYFYRTKRSKCFC